MSAGCPNKTELPSLEPLGVAVTATLGETYLPLRDATVKRYEELLVSPVNLTEVRAGESVLTLDQVP